MEDTDSAIAVPIRRVSGAYVVLLVKELWWVLGLVTGIAGLVQIYYGEVLSLLPK